ncbi:hypothetical protein CYK37_30430 [Mesorhizobium loti]|nr:hypothetical protein [Mesorhizobium loti]PLP55469.1 hypothetical protein CYK37_30430 [Mesorhizobium loti]
MFRAVAFRRKLRRFGAFHVKLALPFQEEVGDGHDGIESVVRCRRYANAVQCCDKFPAQLLANFGGSLHFAGGQLDLVPGRECFIACRKLVLKPFDDTP